MGGGCSSKAHLKVAFMNDGCMGSVVKRVLEMVCSYRDVIGEVIVVLRVILMIYIRNV